MTRLRALALVAMLELGACHRTIDARAVRLVSAAEIGSLLPPLFEEHEGLQGKLVGVVVAIDGRNLRRLAGGSRNPIVRFVRCGDGTDVGYSFGPFVRNDYAQNYVRKEEVRYDRTYSLVATALPRTLEHEGICVQLEARWYAGVMARSARLPLPSALP